MQIGKFAFFVPLGRLNTRFLRSNAFNNTLISMIMSRLSHAWAHYHRAITEAGQESVNKSSTDWTPITENERFLFPQTTPPSFHPSTPPPPPSTVQTIFTLGFRRSTAAVAWLHLPQCLMPQQTKSLFAGSAFQSKLGNLWKCFLRFRLT